MKIFWSRGDSAEEIVSARNSVGALTKKQLKRAERAAAKGELELASIQSGLSDASTF